MTLVRCSLELPGGNWLDDLTSEHPEVSVRLLADVPDGAEDRALVDCVGEEAATLLDGALNRRDVEAVTALSEDPGWALATVSPPPPVFVLCERLDPTLHLPVVVRDGVATLELELPRERIAGTVARLDRFGSGATLEATFEDLSVDGPLSERQRDVVGAAVDRGYYETPRRCSLTELADDLGIAKSTCSEILHRAEQAIVEQYVADRLELPVVGDGEAGSADRPRVEGTSDVGGDDGSRPEEDCGTCDPERVLEVLSNDNFQRLFEHLDEPKTVLELVEECDTPKSTVYRGMRQLESAGIVEPVPGTEATNSRPTEYRRSSRQVTIDFRDSVTVECVR